MRDGTPTLVTGIVYSDVRPSHLFHGRKGPSWHPSQQNASFSIMELMGNSDIGYGIRSSDVVFNEDSIFSGRSRLKIGKKVIFYLSNRDSDKNAFFIPLLPGESRRKGLYSYKDPHREQLVEYADKGVVYGQARRMSKMGRTNETPHVGVKAEFVGKKGPSGWETEESD